MASTREQLTRQIERVIRGHLAETQVAVTEAVARAFLVSKPRHENSKACGPSEIRHRRPGTEISALAEKLYEAVCKKPSETLPAPTLRIVGK